MTISTFVNAAWFCIALFAIASATSAIYAGWNKFRGEFFWRSIKLCASMAALIGVGVTLTNFEIAFRAIWKEPVQEQLFLDFIDARVQIAISMAELCNEVSPLPIDKNTCWDLRNIGNQISFVNLRNRTPLDHIKNWQDNQRIEEVINQANRRIDEINYNMAISKNYIQIIGPTARAFILLSAAFFFALAAAGNLGEAAFQLRAAKDRVSGTPKAPSENT